MFWVTNYLAISHSTIYCQKLPQNLMNQQHLYIAPICLNCARSLQERRTCHWNWSKKTAKVLSLLWPPDLTWHNSKANGSQQWNQLAVAKRLYLGSQQNKQNLASLLKTEFPSVSPSFKKGIRWWYWDICQFCPAANEPRKRLNPIQFRQRTVL